MQETVTARRRHRFGARSEKLDDEQLDGVQEFGGGVYRSRCQF
ncbi:transposase [Sphingomonas faeni]